MSSPQVHATAERDVAADDPGSVLDADAVQECDAVITVDDFELNPVPLRFSACMPSNISPRVTFCRCCYARLQKWRECAIPPLTFSDVVLQHR